MRTIRKLFTGLRKRKAYKEADMVNMEGNVAFSMSDEDLFLQTLLTNTCSDVFYVTKDELLEESLEIHKEMLAKDEKFYAQAVIYARNKGFMRLQPILGCVFLSTLENKGYFKRVFPKVILTPNDLQSFLDLCRTKEIRKGLGRAVKKEIIRYLQEKLTEYHAMKYKKAITDAVRISRPSVRSFDDFKRDILEYVMNNEVSERLTQITAVEDLKQLDPEKHEKKIIELITQGRLPYEAVVGAVKPTTKIWEALLYQMPIMATMRHLNVMVREGVFKSEDAVNHVVEKFKAVGKSRILPFRFHTALSNLDEDAPEKIRDALRDALEISFVNMPELKGRTCIAPDVSGSMVYGRLAKGKTRAVEVAGIFSAALLKKSEDCIVLPVDTSLHPHTCSKRDSIMTNAEKISKLGGGGTELDLPLKYLIDRKIKVDNFICITDSEEWYAEHRYLGDDSRGFYRALLDYKDKVNKDVKVFFIRLMPYGHSTVPKHEPNLYNIEGWSNTVVDFVARISNFGEDQVREVRQIEI